MFDISNLFEATSVEDAISLLETHEQARVIAGGSDILIKLREGELSGCDLVSIFGLDELRGITLGADGTITIRPLSSFSLIEKDENIRNLQALSEAAAQVGGPQIRNIATIGGNICNGAVSADSAPALLTYDAVLELKSSNGVRIVPIHDFYTGPGKVDLGRAELLVGIHIKRQSYEGFGGCYIKYSARRAMDISMLGCAVNLKLSADKKYVEKLCLAYGVAAPTPIRARTAEKEAEGALFNEELLEKVSKLAQEDAMPRTSWRASKEFRLHLLGELCRRAMRTAAKRAGLS